MDGEVSVVFDSLVRAQGFLIANDAALPEVNGSAARHALDSAIAELTGELATQQVAKEQVKGGTHKQRGLVVSLKRQMRAVSGVATGNTDGVEELRKLKPAPANASVNVVVVKAKAMLVAIETYPQLFEAGGLSADSLKRFRTTIDAVSEQVETRNDGASRRVKSTEQCRKAGRDGRGAIKVLDGLVRLYAAADPALLAAWNSAKRMRSTRSVSVVKDVTETQQAA